MDHQTANFIFSQKLNGVDLSIIGFFAMLFIIFTKLVAKKRVTKDSEEFLLMGRTLTLPLFVATLVATWYGGIFGVTQIAFEQGIYSFFTQGLFWYVSYFLFAIFLAKKIRAKKVLSLPELIGQKFGERARKIAAIILFFHAMPVSYAISVGILLKLILGVSFFWGLLIGVTLVAIYTALDGFRGVVFTDCIQFLLMFSAVIIMLVFCVSKFGGLDFLHESLPTHYFAWHGETTFSSAIIWLFLACTSTFIHPVFYQRCLAAKSDSVAIKGIFFAMTFFFVFDVCTTLGGMYARAALPTHDSATAYLALGLDILPHGLRGIFVAGILATILSTLDSFMFVAGTSLSYDLLGDKSIFGAYAHEISILFSAAFVITLGSYFGTDFEATWLFMEGLFSTSVLVPVLASVLWPRRFSNANFIAPALGSMMTFALATMLQRHGMAIIEPFYVAHAVALIIFVSVLHLETKRNTKMANATNG